MSHMKFNSGFTPTCYTATCSNEHEFMHTQAISVILIGQYAVCKQWLHTWQIINNLLINKLCYNAMNAIRALRFLSARVCGRARPTHVTRYTNNARSQHAVSGHWPYVSMPICAVRPILKFLAFFEGKWQIQMSRA